MQRKKPLDYLFPRVRQQVLAATLLGERDQWYLADLSQHLNLHHATLQREITALEHAGVLRRWHEGNRTYFAPNSDCPYLPELRMLLIKTIGLADRVREALSGLESRIEVAFIYGSVARGEETASSDVDLMVIGEIALSDLAERLRPLERELGREVNPSLYTSSEFQSKLQEGAHFLSTVVNAEKLFMLGGANDLARLSEQGSH